MTVSGRQQRSLARHIHVSILPQTPFPSRLQHNIEQSSLHTMLGRSSCFKTSQRYLTMSNAVIFDTHTFLPTLQFLSFLMIFFFLFHTLVTVQKNLSRSDLFCFLIFFFFSMKLTHCYHFKEDNLSGLNLSHEPQTSIANSKLCYVPASNDMLVSV